MNQAQVDDYIRDGLRALRAARDSRTVARLAYRMRGELQRHLTALDDDLRRDPPALAAERLVRAMVAHVFRLPPARAP